MRCQRSVTSSIYVHWSLWWGWGFLLKALHHQLLYLRFTCHFTGHFFCQFYLVLWQQESHREKVLRICSEVSLKCLLKSSLWGSDCGLQSSLMYLRTLEAGSWDIQYVSVQLKPKSLNILPVVTEQEFWCVCVFIYKKMTRWHFLVSCRKSVIVTCRFLSVSPPHSHPRPP